MYQSFPPRDPNPVEVSGSPQAPQAPWRRLSRRGQYGILGVGIAAAALIAVNSFGGQEAQAVAPPPPNVTVSQPLQRSIVEWDDYTGRFEASQSVEIRPRVSGLLVAVHFREGDIVRRGQLLFSVDQRPFLASLNEARARAASAATAAALARSEYARAARLIADEAVSQEEVDSLRAAMRAAEAGVAAAQSVVRQRALDLEFAGVHAPITGRISDRRVDIGNIVAANETTLTTLLAVDPIHFSFDGSEALYLKSLRDRVQGTTGQQVEIKLQDEADYGWKGRVDFTDNALDPRSGTMRGRAVLANPGYFIAPGMFGSMRLTTGSQRSALLVPDGAVRTDQARKVVFVVGADGKVAARPVEPGPLVGGLRSIRSGLGPRDRVVISGVQFAMPGAKVNARAGKIEPPAAALAPPPVEASASQATLAAR